MTRFGFVITTYAAVLFIALTSVFRPAPKLLWNASASVPIGLYALRRALPLHVGELVVVTPPQSLAQFFAARRYLPLGVPLVKHVIALPGQTVCRTGRAITVDGITVGEALDIDAADAAPDHWRHLHNRLIAGEPPRPYSREQHRAWLLRRRLAP